MKTITSNELRVEFKKIWQNLDPTRWQLYTDVEFEEVDLEELLPVLKDNHKQFNEDSPQELLVNDLLAGEPPSRDCDNWAKSADAFVDRYYRKKNDSRLQRAFGKCMFTKVNGVKMRHTKCWCYSNGIWLVEPQVPNITKPTEGDEIWFVTTL